jgi:hypothetical protein
MRDFCQVKTHHPVRSGGKQPCAAEAAVSASLNPNRYLPD